MSSAWAHATDIQVRMLLQTHNWQAVVEGYGPLVWQTAYRILGNHEDVSDCFQETFLTALELSRRQQVRNLPGLLVRLATTRAIDRLRQRARRDRHEAGAYGCERNADPIHQVETQDLAWRLREAIGQLPPQEAKVFCLRHLNEMSYRQIAQEMQIGISAVGVSLHRAKTRLRDLLAETDVKVEVTHESR